MERTLITVFFIVAAILLFIAAVFALFPVGKVGVDALFIVAAFFLWAGLSRLP